MSTNGVPEVPEVHSDERSQALVEQVQAELVALMTRYGLKAMVVLVGFEATVEGVPTRCGFAVEQVDPMYEPDIFPMLMDAIQASQQRRKRNARIAEANRPRIIH